MKVPNNRFVALLVAFAIAVAFFYFIDHGVMSLQNLPLNMDLSPLQ